jgi:signal transduction histidine kinase
MSLTTSYTKMLDAAKNGGITPDLIKEVDASTEEADLEYLAEEIPSAIDQSLEGITRISNIVRAMKQFSHPGTKDRESTDINEAIRSTITVASNEWKYVADIETDLADDLPPVICFAQEINQVLLNIIVNAAHAIDAAKKDETDAKGTIRISSRAHDDRVEIAIADTGCGIPDDIKHRIFDPFFTTKDIGKGTGQGLAMAYKTVVDQHHGQLKVDSVANVGTTFTISLPVKSMDLHSEEAAA